MTVRKRTVVPERTPVCWNPEKHGITQGLIATWLACRHHAYLQYVCGWKSRSTSKPLEFGSAFHHFADHVGGKGKDLYKVKMNYLRDKMSSNPSDPGMLTKVIEEAAVTYPLYREYWEKYDKDYTVLHSEEVFKVGKDDIGVDVTGRMDGVIRTKKKLVLLKETKTKGKIDEEGIEETLELDIQTNLYLYALSKSHPEYKASGVLYDVVRQSQLRQGVNESLETYCKKLQEDIKTRPEFYFHRWEETLTAQHAKEWLDTYLRKVAGHILDWYYSVTQKSHDGSRYPHPDPKQSPYHYITPQTLLGLFGGAKSQYFAAITRKDFSSLYLSEVPFPELID